MTRVHLGPCTNPLPGETVDALHDQLARIAAPLRRALGGARLAYTLDLARILVELLPADVETGSISTLPVGARGAAPGPARANLEALARELEALVAGLVRELRWARAKLGRLGTDLEIA